jgi:hypothetical protein
MTSVPAELWPWLALAGLGFFHGVNPAMGWLFAVALGLHRHSSAVVLLSLLPIALGHALAIALVVVAVLGLGVVIEHGMLGRIAGAILIAWAAWHAVYGRRHRVRVGMQTGLAGLALWSFLMASAHGAGLMLIPVLIPLCLSGATSGMTASSGAVAIAAVALHTGVMLATIALISLVVYEWVGLAFLRTAWINLDLVWIVALGLCGALLLIL